MVNRKFGALFGSGIIRGSNYRRPQTRVSSPRWVFAAAFLFVLVLISLGRLIDLQLVQGSYFASLAQDNRIRRIPVKAPRGEILDRNGQALARNAPVYKIATFSSSGVVTETKIISQDVAFQIQSSGGEEANRILVDIGREYPLGEQAAHVVGYVNEASPEEIREKPKCNGEASNFQFPVSSFQLGDLVGRMGIEQQYDCVLRGKNGEELIEVDTRGRLVRRLGRREPVPGTTITLTIDSNLQEVAYNAILEAPNSTRTGLARESGNLRAGLVAQDSQNGEVLALVSIPSFDPNKISENYDSLADDKNLPFFNRAIGGSYHPGSTFKIVTAVAGLEDGKIDENYEYEDRGIIVIGAFSYRNWLYTKRGGTEGFINIVRAITRSTDTFFYKVGELVGPDRLAFWAGELGMGAQTVIDLPGEAVGIIPTPEWKEKVRGERWFLGNTYHMAIGQGDVTATPLQINQMTSVVASNGKLCVPRMVQEVSQESRVPQVPRECKSIGLKSETIRLVTEGMMGACSPGGTAYPLFDFKPQVACKTGTAETVGENTHAWLTAFAPSDNPQITVTALIEEGGEGSDVAAPVVKKVLEEWFGR